MQQNKNKNKNKAGKLFMSCFRLYPLHLLSRQKQGREHCKKLLLCLKGKEKRCLFMLCIEGYACNLHVNEIF